mgnify:CR=1 FL=1
MGLALVHFQRYWLLSLNCWHFVASKDIIIKFKSQGLMGGFQLLDLIIPELKSHVIPYKFKSSHWLRANLVKDFFLQMNFPPMRALEFITGHVIFKLRYLPTENHQ